MPFGASPGAEGGLDVIQTLLRMWEGTTSRGNGPWMAKNSKGLLQRTQWPPFLHLSNPRQKIFKEKALPDIENYMFENHDQLRQAATECMCNMVLNKEVSWVQYGDGA